MTGSLHLSFDRESLPSASHMLSSNPQSAIPNLIARWCYEHHSNLLCLAAFGIVEEEQGYAPRQGCWIPPRPDGAHLFIAVFREAAFAHPRLRARAEINSHFGASAGRADARRRDEVDVGHRRGAATKPIRALRRRVPSGCGPQARWLCCSLLTYRPGYSSSLAPRQRAWGPAAKCEFISARALRERYFLNRS